ASRRTDEHHDLAPLNRQIDGVHRGGSVGGKPLGDLLEADHRVVGPAGGHRRTLAFDHSTHRPEGSRRRLDDTIPKAGASFGAPLPAGGAHVTPSHPMLSPVLAANTDRWLWWPWIGDN